MDGSQILSQLSDNSSSSSVSSALSGMQSQLGLILWLGTIGSVVIIIGFIVYLIYKMRVQSAILRIDKNLQRLVDAQLASTQQNTVPAETKSEATASESAREDMEQK